MGDRWKKEDLRASDYLWLPIRFDGDRAIVEWREQWDLGVFGH